MPTKFLGGAIPTLCFVGVHSLRNSVIDCAVAGVFGIIGFILKRLSLLVMPIILGLVLAGIMEFKLQTAMIRIDSPLDFIYRPISFILSATLVGVVLGNFWSVRLTRNSCAGAKE